MEEIEPTERIAILWSVNPSLDYGPDRELVGSVHAHIGHLQSHGAVYWRLVFNVGEDTVKQFPYPISGYLYNTAIKKVDYRARVVNMTTNPKARKIDYVPLWRREERSGLFILIDQLEEVFPQREIGEFRYAKDGKPVEGPPKGNYHKVLDPLF